ncbi:MAG: hypothetical protein GX678_03595 [Actinomycetales bacterium]|nr:hypothetical protein [Actinomycetales bacterium]
MTTSNQNHDPVIELTSWTGPWPEGDRDANLKEDVALYAALDPLHTLEGLSRGTGIPVGALARYVLAKYATSGSGGLLEIGPVMVNQLWSVFEQAEAKDTEQARLAAYDQVRQIVSWLRYPLENPHVYPEQI